MEKSVRLIYSSILEETLETKKGKIIMYFLGFFLTLLTGIAIIEIKHIYEINIFPNYDFMVDNVYYDFKEWLGL